MKLFTALNQPKTLWQHLPPTRFIGHENVLAFHANTVRPLLVQDGTRRYLHGHLERPLLAFTMLERLAKTSDARSRFMYTRVAHFLSKNIDLKRKLILHRTVVNL